MHQVIGGGPMPAYVRRPHDELLRAVLDPAVPASRLVVVRGGSSTGKTRAAYEAVADRLADWQLDYPLDPGALAARLEAGIPARTVLWLGELRQYADADGGAAVLGRLADLLEGEGHLVITTMWPEHWNTYTAAARAGPGTADPAGTAGRLLERLPELTGSDPARIDPARGGVIDVPDQFTAADLDAAARTGDPVLAEAAAAAASAGQDGQVTQYLAGVPDLLRRYAGPGGDPYGQAVITAAMDATRLGHASPLPAALLQEAAVGYLTGPQRTKDIASWRDTALAWATEELNGAVRALQPVPPAVRHRRGRLPGRRLPRPVRPPHPPGPARPGLPVGRPHRPRRQRQRPDPPRAGRTRPRPVPPRRSPMDNSGNPGQHRRRTASSSATCARSAPATPPAPPNGPPATSASTTRGHVAGLLRELREAGAGDAVTYPGRPGPPPTPASTTRGPSPGCCGRCARPGPATRSPPWPPGPPATSASTTRGPSPAAAGAARGRGRRRGHHPAGPRPRRPRQPRRPAGRRLAAAGAARGRGRRRGHRPWPPGPPATSASTTRGPSPGCCGRCARPGPATRSPPCWPATPPATPASTTRGPSPGCCGSCARPGPATRSPPCWPATRRPRQPRRPGGRRRAAAGAARGRGQRRGHRPGHPGRRPRQPRRPAGRRPLLRELREAGASDAVAALLARDPAGHASLDDPGAVAELLEELREAGAGDAVTALAGPRPPATPASTTRGPSPSCCGRCARPGPATRSPPWPARAAGHASLDDPRAVASLLGALREAGASDAVTALLARDPAGHASLDDPGAVAELLGELREAGAGDAVTALLARDPAGHASLDNPWAVAALLEELREAGAGDAVTALAVRAANAGMFDLFLKVCPDEASSYPFGREPDGTPSQPWNWQEPANQNRGPRSR